MSGGKGGGEQTVGYKYFMGAHLVLCAGSVDKIVKIEVDDRIAWEGTAEPDGVDPGLPVRVNVSKPKLFGGDGREGGISGALDVLFGYATQPINDYLQAKIGSSLLSAYRGVTSIVLRRMYVGNNPYLKPWAVTAQRIHTRESGETQWYDEKAEMLTVPTESDVRMTENFSALGPNFSSYSSSVYSVSGNVLTCNDVLSTSILKRFIPEDEYTYVSVEFRVTDPGIGDACTMYIAGLLYLNPMREKIVDINQRIEVNGVYIETADTGVWYSVSSRANGDVNDVIVKREGVQIASFSTARTPEPASFIDWVSEDGAWYSGGMVTQYRNLVVEKTTRYETGDMNPTHIIYEILTENWGRGLPESDIGATYQTVADQLYNEGLGLSFEWTEEAPITDLIDEVIRHIDAVRYEDPETGLQEIKLIRGDYDITDLPLLNRSNSRITKLETTSHGELINQVTVKYRNREMDSESSYTVQDTAAITLLGTVINQTIEYPGITQDEVAVLVAARDLAAGSRPFYRGSLEMNRVHYNLKPGDVFKLTDEDQGLTEMVCRVAKRTDNGSLNGEITIEFGEDVYGTQYNAFSAPTTSGWVDYAGPAQDFRYRTAYEKPYLQIVREIGDSYLDNVPADTGYFCFTGVRPESGAHVNYRLYSYPDGDVQDPNERVGVPSDFTAYAVVASDVADPSTTLIPVSVLEDSDEVRIGDIALIGNSSDAVREIAAVDALMTDNDSTITLKRGVADTLPQQIAEGTVIYFIGDSFGETATEYLTGELVEGYGTPINGSGEFAGPFSYETVEMRERFALPYPPANFKVDGAYVSNGELDVGPSDTSFVFTWNHRDRSLQSDQIISWFDASDYGPETGQTYRIEVDALDGDEVLIVANYVSTNVGAVKTFTLDLTSDVPPAGTVWLAIRVMSVRDSKYSLQSIQFKIQIGISAPAGLTATNV